VHIVGFYYTNIRIIMLIMLCHNSIQSDGRTHHTMQSLSSDGTIPFREWINVEVIIGVEVTSRLRQSTG